MNSNVVVRRPLRVWLVGFVVVVGLCIAWAAWGAAPALAAGITATDPVTNVVGVDLNANIEAIYDASIDPTTVTTQTFVAQGMMSGLRDGTFSIGGDTMVKLDPDDDYFPGEVVRVSATGAISDAGGLPVTPYQWQFTAGPVISRCVFGFTDIGANLPAVYRSSVAWGDYDNDGDLDILFTGETSAGMRIARVYRNDGGGSFIDIGAGLPGVSDSSVAWGDYDNDGDLDILLTGNDGTGFVASVYRNDSGSFTYIVAGLPGVGHSSVAWGDYDNDGDLDILLTGYAGASIGFVASVYRNDGGGSFVDIVAGLPGVSHSSVAWGDYDNDGDLDILLTGDDGDDEGRTNIYNNDDGTFFDTACGLETVYRSSVAWGDYDDDRDLDFLLTGATEPDNPFSRLCRNDGEDTFTPLAAGLPSVYDSSVAWDDYDNDGDLDILLTGYGASTRITQVYRNSGGSFSDIGAGLPGVAMGSVAWGDYDNDDDLDILLTGYTAGTELAITRIYRNDDCLPWRAYLPYLMRLYVIK